ncbi:MAG: excalibur calcium-binding domain-containing protein [Paracoccaceae bacterium]
MLEEPQAQRELHIGFLGWPKGANLTCTTLYLIVQRTIYLSKDNSMTSVGRAIIAVLFTFCADAAFAHSGGLNASGCHNNRKTGDYHCHRAQQPRVQSQRPNQPNNFIGGGRAFRNCAEARAAGAAPVYRGEAGYGRHLDRDNDGIGCE